MPAPFEALEDRLLRGGIAPRHVRRYLRELSEHLADLTAAQAADGHDPADAAARARAALGPDGELADAMLKQRDFRAWSVRAPWAVFGLLVPVAITVGYALVAIALVGIAKLHGFINAGTIAAPLWYRDLAQAIALAANLALPLLLGSGLAWLARRQRLSFWWPMLGAILIAAIAMQIRVVFAVPGQHGGSISIGALIWWSRVQRDHDGFHLSLMLVQAMLVLTPIAVLTFARHMRLRAH